ncbi:amidohydrolase family protein [Spelaeicoccus albus]|nr:amidohydrolase family protein [Spelaeicoccus albus]
MAADVADRKVAVMALDVLLTGGRVIDPESGLDGVRNVGIRGGTVAYIGDDRADAARTIDVSGHVVAPGFIDMHSHAQTISGHRLQALDGVTTSLELEGGALPVADHYEWAESEGRPLNFGFSAGWVYSRMHVLDGAPAVRPQDDREFRIPLGMFEQFQDGARWRGPADGRDIGRILDLVERQLRHGAIGIGMLAGYAPDFTAEEFGRLADLAAETTQPMFIHARSMSAEPPGSALDAAQEIIAEAEAHSAPMHLCHMNSTSGHLADSVAESLAAARARGVPVTTEAYPYAAGSTVIGASFLAPDELRRNRMTPSSITYLPTGERVASEERLVEIRANDPGGLCVLESFDLCDPADKAMLLRAQTVPDAAIASDAMPLTFFGTESQRHAAECAATGDVWPLPPGLIAHPRSTGCFARALSWLVRDTGVLTLPEAIRRCTLIPAQILEEAAPAMRAKGRLRVGADADLTVFDPATVAARGDYTSLRPSTGFRHVFVGGTPVVADGELDAAAFPGKAVRGAGARAA